NHSQSEDVGLLSILRLRLGWPVTRCSCKSGILARLQPIRAWAWVRKFGLARDENNVLRLDGTVDQRLAVYKLQRFSQADADAQTFPSRQTFLWCHFAHPGQIPRPVAGGILVPTGLNAVAERHNVIKVASGLLLTD